MRERLSSPAQTVRKGPRATPGVRVPGASAAKAEAPSLPRSARAATTQVWKRSKESRLSRFFVTTPIFYVNAKPHLGHAFTTILADAMTRFHRLMGDEAFFLTGTDEHGDKIAKASDEAGQSPKEYADQISGLFRALGPMLGAKPDHFIRTTDPEHIKTVQKVLQKVYEAGDIYFGEYGGHYCFGCERFYTEKELVDGMCPDHKTRPEYIAEKNYFFRMSKYQAWLIEHINQNPDFIRPARYRNEVLSLLESGALEDLCISRPKSRLTWGIELPFDQDFVCYVWFDALLNYVSALNYPRGEKFKKFWPANHIVAKDILKPHAVFWPTMLKAAGLAPYQSLNVHGYWLVRDTKMSKSLGNVVEPKQMVDAYGTSAFRYFLLREMAFGSDASFTEEALVGRLNADLANDLGNLFNRVLSMTHKYFEGKVPSPTAETEEDAELKRLGRDAMRNFQGHFAEFRTARALESLWELVRALNKYIDTSAPWTLFKNKDKARLGTVMYMLLEHMRKIAVHLWPVMPEASVKMLEQLGCCFDLDKVNLAKEPEVWGLLDSGLAVLQTSNLFPRVEVPEPAPPAALEVETPKAPAAEPKKKAPPKAPEGPVGPADSIEFADFQKLDLRVGTVLSAAKHPDADKLLVVQVALGDPEPRQIVAGLADRFSPEDLVGKQVVVVANLAPRKLRGIQSQGMILVAKDAEVTRLLTAAGTVDDGGKVA
ncbi:MAG: methionine--tRNA ligase [Humidesulfovibrio sp.]|nr:methionine--tRNA ligase [Humidesulfovibrio sp.]MDQ7834219.1 methionine--tRNA ligase [Humidesulfovibrio sp.]